MTAAAATWTSPMYERGRRLIPPFQGLVLVEDVEVSLTLKRLRDVAVADGAKIIVPPAGHARRA